MAQHVQPGRLKLSFICDTGDFETAKALLTPLRAFPTVNQCSIRLSQTPDRNIQRLVEETIEHLSTSTIQTPFPFLVLPAELQSQILAQTDLVAPFGLKWRLSKGYFRNSRWVLLPGSGCLICADVRKPCCTTLDQSSADSRCSCWRFPKELFRVNRSIRQEALCIFYSNNHIALHYEGCKEDPKLNLSLFLSLIPRYTRNSLRSLQFIFPDARCLLPGSQASNDLTTAVNILRADANLSKLTLAIEICIDDNCDYDGRYHKHAGESNGPAEESRWISYQKIAEPIYPLQGLLKDCFVKLPWVYYGENAETRQKHEQVLERRIMGDEEYDSVCQGKYERPDIWGESGFQVGEVCPWAVHSESSYAIICWRRRI